MKILNRPMFRYGGPIKEGIMDGIQEPRQGYQQSGMVFPGDVNRMMPTGVNTANSAKAFQGIFKGPGINEAEAAKMRARNQNKNDMKKYINLTEKTMPKENIFMGNQETDVNLDAPQRVKVPKYIEDQDGDGIRDLNPEWEQGNWLEKNVLGVSKEYVEPDFSAKATGAEMPANLSPDMGAGNIEKKPELPTILNNTEANRKKNINGILEKLGYARSQKNALYDALIAGGQRISREGLGKTNLVNDLIADTSTAYDKPEKIREAAELMQVQQDLKLEGIRESKTGGARQQDYDYYINQGDSPALAKQKADGVATTIVAMKERAKKMGDGQGDAQVESVAQQMVDGNWFPDRDYKGTISGKKYDNITEFVESAEFKSKKGGIYVVKGKVIELDDNGKMIFDKVVTSSTSNSKWWNPLD
jgi:hypothetical protein